MNIDDIVYGQVSDEFGFRYREITTKLTPEEQRLQINTLTHNVIYFQLEGELSITWNGIHSAVIHPGELYFLPRGANISACIGGNKTKYIAARLEHDLDNAEAFNNLIKRIKAEDRGSYTFKPLPIVEPMRIFLDSIRQYIEDDVTYPQLQRVKLIELIILFRRYYTNEERSNLFYPIVDGGSEFKTYILNNFQPHISIDELASNANMSRSTFDRKFKEAFGMTPLKWFNVQTRILIYRKAAEPNVTVKDLMYEVGVYNSSQFTKLCKRICGVTPSSIIHSH